MRPEGVGTLSPCAPTGAGDRPARPTQVIVGSRARVQTDRLISISFPGAGARGDREWNARARRAVAAGNVVPPHADTMVRGRGAMDTKRDRLVEMFGRIAHEYDRMNSILSMGLHHGWRRIAVRECRLPERPLVLDVAVGTGDFAIEAVGKSGMAVGVDPCAPMLLEGRAKLGRLGLQDRIRLVVGAAEALPVPDNLFDAATIGFALRNVTDIDRTFAEMARAVRPGGRVVALEIAKPQLALLRPLFFLYFYHLSPRVAQLFGGDHQAYHYLPNSLKEFWTREQLIDSMRRAGLVEVEYRDLSGGMTCIYTGTKPAAD
ncbi:MAG: ubiquinone/menaquinone biosynthesis methyltransferase, partial [Armatimonadetes bacterium]|nr:ubiquinone/menaquinone biosynthesis methyltransferase [Armatimonadota bacterium]